MARLLSLVPYLLPFVVFVGAIVDLIKDWDKYNNAKLKMMAPLVLVLVCALTVINQYHDNTEKAEATRKSTEQNQNLQGQVKAANDAQRDNTTLFLAQFEKLNQQVSDLKTEVKTDTLQKRLTSVQADLEATQRALEPGPKATLAFSFMDAKAASQLQALTDAIIPVNSEGNVHVEFTLMNPTEVDALDVQVNLNICDQCRFAKEPPGFIKLSSELDTERFRQFANIPAKSVLETMTADISLPPPYAAFVVGLKYRCRTCVLPKVPLVGTVKVVRETLQMRKDVLQQKHP
jgi:hypothetical protein